jgi:hypothetical protein
MQNTQNTAETEQVEVSASKLQLLLSKYHEDKTKYSEEISKLMAKIKADEAKMAMYEEVLQKMQLGHKTRSAKRGDTSRKVTEEIEKINAFDNWYRDNKDKLADECYGKYYAAELDAFKKKMETFLN